MLKIETIINGEAIIFIMPSNDLDREICKTVKSDSVITTVSITGAQYHGKAVPEKTIKNSPKPITLEQGEKTIDQE